jgi:hypothetical protein
MSDRVNPAMNAVEASRLNSAGQAAPMDSHRVQLLKRDHPVLTGGNPRDRRIRLALGDF